MSAKRANWIQESERSELMPEWHSDSIGERDQRSRIERMLLIFASYPRCRQNRRNLRQGVLPEGWVTAPGKSLVARRGETSGSMLAQLAQHRRSRGSAMPRQSFPVFFFEGFFPDFGSSTEPFCPAIFTVPAIARISSMRLATNALILAMNSSGLYWFFAI